MPPLTHRRPLLVAIAGLALAAVAAVTLVTGTSRPAQAQLPPASPASCSCTTNTLEPGATLHNCQCGAMQCIVSTVSKTSTHLVCMK